MKKMFIIIIILAIIFVGMVVYKNTAVGSKNNVSVNEVQEIEQYISGIYMWEEVTNEALPIFEDINNANDLWTWEVIKKNLEQYEISYEEIKQKSKEIFGESFTKEFPKEGTSSFEYDEEIDKYFATEIITDNKEDLFLLSNINKTSEGYIVDIIEYLEDYSEENNIKVVNFNNEEIGNISISENESKVQEIVKNNKERFSKKRVVLKKENDKLVVQKVEKV
ncbi:MAG: hypothetical protein HFJ40_03330 [Clostridia bacterium]|nr:hypothetical protein [Clostridia bacterium]